ncbi:MAG TPA: Trm112 family protein [Tepidisphaeraceae bacterium]|nr:Trm112 family protein [Tepidisphaeraceae bacterium]
MPETRPNNVIDPELLDLLRCPLTHSRLRQDGDFLVAEAGGLAYPVRDGIPVMLVEEARLPAGFATLDDFKKAHASLLTH